MTPIDWNEVEEIRGLVSRNPELCPKQVFLLSAIDHLRAQLEEVRRERDEMEANQIRAVTWLNAGGWIDVHSNGEETQEHALGDVVRSKFFSKEPPPSEWEESCIECGRTFINDPGRAHCCFSCLHHGPPEP